MFLKHITVHLLFVCLQVARAYHCTFGGCGACLSTRRGFQMHMKRHLGIYQYQCPYCNKGLSATNDIKYHLRSEHTGMFGIHCNLCRQEFDNVRLLKAHLEANVCQPNIESVFRQNQESVYRQSYENSAAQKNDNTSELNNENIAENHENSSEQKNEKLSENSDEKQSDETIFPVQALSVFQYLRAFFHPYAANQT